VTFCIYLDEHVDTALATLLPQAGDFHVLTTVGEGRANKEISDEDQIQYATEQGCAILTHNISDFEVLAREWAEAGRQHAGILLALQMPAYQLVNGVGLDCPDVSGRPA
jgi:hypothetical protein